VRYEFGKLTEYWDEEKPHESESILDSMFSVMFYLDIIDEKTDADSMDTSYEYRKIAQSEE
jgi:hypothetical protein